MSNSPLINATILDPYCSPDRKTGGREYKITKITIHHAASVGATGESVARYLQKKKGGSANYCIGNGGDIVLSVPEEKRAWTSSNAKNDAQAVTIEVANVKGAPNWEISDVALARLVDLCVDICRRNGMPGLTWTGDSNGTLTAHYMFAATACPGPYLKSKLPWIAKEVTRRVNELGSNPSAVDIQKPTAPKQEKPLPPQTITTSTQGGYSPAMYKEQGFERGKTLSVIPKVGLNCRKNASREADIITTFTRGTKVTWYGYYNKDNKGNRWLLVKGPRATGYCMETYLK